MDQETFEDVTTGTIQTLNRIEIHAWLKGYEPKKQIAVITLGGIFENRATIVYPALQLELNRIYMLFLDVEESEKADPLTRVREPELRQSFTYADAQGALKLDKGLFHDQLVLPPLSENEVLARLARLTGEPAKTSKGDFYRPSPETPNTPTQSDTVSTISPNPTNAGTIVVSEFLTITGSGFGAAPGTVSFANADDGGSTSVLPPNASDYVSWSDSSITVKAPRRAGTGTVTVNGSMTAPSSLTINYSHIEINDDFYLFGAQARQRYYLRNINTLGGYTFQYNSTSGFSDNAPAVAALERALASWRCSTFVNFTRTKTSTTTGLADDGVNVVLFDATLPDGVLGRATSRFTGGATGSCNQANTVWWLTEVDMQFKPDPPVSGYPWEYGPGAPAFTEFDFESVAVHELGHGHGLGHRIASGEVMHYAISNGAAIRSPAANEVAGGNAKMAYSTAATCFNPTGSGTPMTALTAPTCNFIDDPFDTDDDDDGVADGSDCAPSDSATWSAPTQARNLTITGTTLNWDAPAPLPGTATQYDVLRSASSSSFDPAVCVASNQLTTSKTDATAPDAGAAFYYVIRSENACGSHMGAASDGASRTGVACP